MYSGLLQPCTSSFVPKYFIDTFFFLGYAYTYFFCDWQMKVFLNLFIAVRVLQTQEHERGKNEY